MMNDNTAAVVATPTDATVAAAAASAPDDADYVAYVWAYFTGEGANGEQVSLAVSHGNDALHWQTLNDGRPLLVSHQGTSGLRDPCILRAQGVARTQDMARTQDVDPAKDAARFFMLATDLNIAALHGDFSLAQRLGSTHLEVWESADLVDWGEQRHVEVCPQERDGFGVGNVWAPEAHWVPQMDAYAVYWASNLYDGDRLNNASQAHDSRPTYNRMMIATTKDFRTFSAPQVWVDVCGGDGHDGRGTIDATVTKEGEWWHRFIKDERTMQVRHERSRNLFATVRSQLPGYGNASRQDGDAWQLVKEAVGVGLPNGEHDEHGNAIKFTHGEGPCIVRANQADVNGYGWFLFIDQPKYHGGPDHYVCFATNDLDDPDGWQPVSGKLREGLPVNADGGMPRHGTVLPITARERDRLLEHLG